MIHFTYFHRPDRNPAFTLFSIIVPKCKIVNEISQIFTNDCVKFVKIKCYGKSVQNKSFLFVKNDEMKFWVKKILAKGIMLRYF